VRLSKIKIKTGASNLPPFCLGHRFAGGLNNTLVKGPKKSFAHKDNNFPSDNNLLLLRQPPASHPYHHTCCYPRFGGTCAPGLRRSTNLPLKHELVEYTRLNLRTALTSICVVQCSYSGAARWPLVFPSCNASRLITVDLTL
jgi:hypothetical protein